MPVTSQRRSSILAGGKIYSTPTSTICGSSVDTTSSAASSISDHNTIYRSYADRTGMASRLSSPSQVYNSNLNGYLHSSSYSKYLPRSYSSYNNHGSILSGGSATLSTYRGACKSLTNNDVNSSNRYTVNKRLKEFNNEFKDTKRLPQTSDCCGTTSKRRSELCSSPASLARLVATSGLDIYEKYSPAYYKPNTHFVVSKSSDVSNENATREYNTPQPTVGLTSMSNQYSKSFNHTDDATAIERSLRYPRLKENTAVENSTITNRISNNIKQNPSAMIISRNSKNYDNDKKLLKIEFGTNVTHARLLDSDTYTFDTMDVDVDIKEIEKASSPIRYVSDATQNIYVDKNLKTSHSDNSGEDFKNKALALVGIISNGMRRSSNGIQFGKESNVTNKINKVDNYSAGNSFKKTTLTRTVTTKTVPITSAISKKLIYVTSNSPYSLTKIGDRTQYKPLLHRNSAANTNLSPKLCQTNNNHLNRGNNTLQDGFNNGNNNNYNRMQTLSDRDDIKFIDSDDQSIAIIFHGKSQITGAQQATNIAKGIRRPKSTFISSPSQSSSPSAILDSLHFEKVNNGKYRNAGGAVNLNVPVSKISVTVGKPAEQCKTRSPDFDLNGLHVSKDICNEFSERCHLSGNSSTLRSECGNTANNLPTYRHSCEFESYSLRLPNSTASPKTNSGNKSLGNRNTVSGGVSTGQLLYNFSNNTGSLPLRNSWKIAQSDMSAINARTVEIPHTSDRNINRKETDSIGGDLCDTSDTSIRNPVHSSVSSRYWNRDISKSCLGTLSSANAQNHIGNVRRLSKNDEPEGLCGLRNIGNTCFMNSIIQCLSHTDELTKFLRNYNTSRTSLSKDQQILSEFSKLIREMWTQNVHSVTPMELKRAFSAKHRMYSDYNQQDAQEFLRFFLDSLHSALNTGTKGEHLRVDENLSDNNKADITWEWYCQHENSIIRDLFVGQLKSTLRCTVCGNTSVTFDPFWDLSVPLPSSSRCKLDACLDLFIQEEVLDGDEMPTCSKCKTRRKCTKSFAIQRFPKYLVIHLKRFSETRWSKLSNIVEFPTGERELNMGPYGSNTSSNIHYSLYAISNHMGSTAGGHYVAICKHPISKKWHEFNDNLVSDALLEHHLVSSSAYILFFERV